MIRIRAVLLVVLLTALGYLGATGWTELHRAPRLEISPEFHVGELTHDQELDLSIGFRNVGNDILKMERPIPGCQCNLGELSRSEFAPGEQGHFRVKLRPARPPGSEYAQEIVVPSNDPLEPARTVVVRGRMAGGLVAHPEAVHISGLTLGEEWTRVLTVACTDSEAQFEITSVRCDLPDCEMTGPLPVIDRPSHEGLAFQFDVLQMPRSVGKSIGHIVVQTNHSRYKTIRIPVDVEVRSQLTMRPASLLFDLARPALPQSVSVTSPKGIRLTATDSGADDEIYDIVLTEDPVSTGWTVTVGLKPQIKVQSVLKSEIRLNVSGLDGEKVLRIPVSIVPAVMSSSG